MGTDQLQASPAFELSDIYYTIFRHKWKIILCSLAGFGLAVGYYKLRPAPFLSTSKLLILDVVTEGRAKGPTRDDSVTKSPDRSGETVLGAEVEILTSGDLALDVATNVGPERILSALGGGKDAGAAAGFIMGNLKVVPLPSKSTINITFSHPDPAIVQPVLQDLFFSYKKRHEAAHRAIGGEWLEKQKDQWRGALNQAEDDLRKAMARAGITSLTESKGTSAALITAVHSQILDVNAQLAERKAKYNSLTQGIGAPAQVVERTESDPPAETVEEYQAIARKLAQLNDERQRLLQDFTIENSWVQDNSARINESRRRKEELESQYPLLLKSRIPLAIAQPDRNADDLELAREAASIGGLEAKLSTLETQMKTLRDNAAKVEDSQTAIAEIQRARDQAEKNYLYYSDTLEQSRTNEARGTGGLSNISQIQTPTYPMKDKEKRNKILGGLAVGGIALGLGWAFLIELLLDRSLRKPGDIEKFLHLPLFLSIPRLKFARKSDTMLGSTAPFPQLPGGLGEVSTAVLTAARPNLPGPNPALSPFYETLRDRLFSYFDSINIRHKPKLVAVTGVGRNSGVTSVAAGLARSISETGEGNVLLVDMTQGQGSAQHFHKGKSVGLDQLFETLASAQVNGNLYVVGESSNSERLAKGMPQRFNQLVPKLKASAFDYIIFDMPAVNQISITPRLVGFMDMVLLVVESEKTDKDIARRATSLLMQSKGNVGVVLNKTISYVPSRLHQDHDFLLGT